MSEARPPRRRPAAVPLALALTLFAAAASAQTTPAQITKYKEAVYPEALLNAQQQGNVLLVGRIDSQGNVQNLRAFAASHDDLVPPALDAVRQWRFKPATRDGKPIDIAMNVAVRFRAKSEKRGVLPQPILGDVPVFPADAAGKKTGPEGFPIRRGADPKLRAEPILDVTPQGQARKVVVRVEAISPRGRAFPIHESTVTVPANASEVRVPFAAPVGGTWEDGIWGLRFTADGLEAGGGQFWIAGDPATFDFAAARTP